MKLLIWIKAIGIYFLIMLDKIFTIPFSGVQIFTVTELVKKDYKLKKVLKRVIRCAVIYGLIALIYTIL
jgi:hypothetical protein